MRDKDTCKSCGKKWIYHNGIQRTCAENIKLTQRIIQLEKALIEIKHQDYRGCRSIESQIAERSLEPQTWPSK